MKTIGAIIVLLFMTVSAMALSVHSSGLTSSYPQRLLRIVQLASQRLSMNPNLAKHKGRRNNV